MKEKISVTTSPIMTLVISIPSFFADTISVLQNGKIVEQGSYENLLQIENGHFKSLVRK